MKTGWVHKAEFDSAFSCTGDYLTKVLQHSNKKAERTNQAQWASPFWTLINIKYCLKSLTALLDSSSVKLFMTTSKLGSSSPPAGSVPEWSWRKDWQQLLNRALGPKTAKQKVGQFYSFLMYFLDKGQHDKVERSTIKASQWVNEGCKSEKADIGPTWLTNSTPRYSQNCP